MVDARRTARLTTIPKPSVAASAIFLVVTAVFLIAAGRHAPSPLRIFVVIAALHAAVSGCLLWFRVRVAPELCAGLMLFFAIIAVHRMASAGFTWVRAGILAGAALGLLGYFQLRDDVRGTGQGQGPAGGDDERRCPGSICIEDSRPLREFYTDPEQRVRVHYRFAHQFLPRYVHENAVPWFRSFHGPCGADPTRSIQARWVVMEQMAQLAPRVTLTPEGRLPFRRVSDLQMSVRTIAGFPAVLICMPPPEAMPLAHFVAVVLLAEPRDPASWPRDTAARVFCLERSDYDRENGPGTLGEWSADGTHSNLGHVAGRPSASSFVRAVARMVK